MNLTWPSMMDALRHDSAGSAPLYYLLLKPWRGLFGESEVALRALSIFFFAGAIVVVSQSARCVAGPTAGLIAALLFSVSTSVGLAHATTARMYMLLGLLSALSILATMRLFREASLSTEHEGILPFQRKFSPKPRYVILVGIHVLGLMTHPLYIFSMAGLTISSLVVARRLFVPLLTVAAASLLVYLAVFFSPLLTSLNLPATSWMHRPSLSDLESSLLLLWGTAKTLTILGFTVVLAALRRQMVRLVAADRILQACAVFLASVVLLPFAASQFKPVFEPERIPVIFLPMACILLALLFTRLLGRLLTVVLLAVLVFASVRWIATVGAVSDPIPVRATMQQLARMVRCGDAVIGGLSLPEAQYYFRRLGVPACVSLEGFPKEQEEHPGFMDTGGLLANRSRLAAEAQTMASRFASDGPSKVWLLFPEEGSPPTQVAAFLKADLDERLNLVDKLNMRGSFFSSVLVYSAGPPR